MTLHPAALLVLAAISGLDPWPGAGGALGSRPQEPGAPAAQDASPGAQEGEKPAAPARHELQLTLEDALRIAVENNLDLEIEELATDVASYNATGSWGAFDPTFSLTGSYRTVDLEGTSQLSGGTVITNDSIGVNSSLNLPLTTGGSLDVSIDHSNDNTTNTFALFGTSTTDVITVALTQPLLRGAWRRYATTIQREAEIDYERQREHEKEVRQGMLFDVYSAYWDLAAALEELDVRHEAVSLAMTQLQQDKKRLEVGTGTEVDVLQSQTNLAQQQELEINAQFAVEQAEDDLRRILWQKPAGDAESFLDEWDWRITPLTPLPDIDEEMELDWRSSLARAIQLRPELWQRRLEIDAAEVRLERARSNRLPGLDATLSSSSVGFDSDPSEALKTAYGWDFPEYRAALTYTVPIFNRTANYAERAARAGVRQARLVYDRWEINILAEVKTAVRDVEFRIESVKAAHESAQLAEAQLKAEQARQEIGLSTTFQVTQFQQTLSESRSAEVADRVAHAKALAGLARAEGRLDVRPVDLRPVEEAEEENE